jgi:hypothetical protein
MAVVRTGKDEIRNVFLDMLDRVNRPAGTPADEPTLAERIHHDPACVFNPLAGPDGGPARADPWQADLLHGHLEDPHRKWLVCCARQTGKSQTAAALALETALVQPESTTLIISRSLRQSAEVMRKVRLLYWGLRGESLRSKNNSGSRNRPRPFRPRPYRQWQQAEERALVGEAARQADPEKAVRDSVLTMEFGNGSRIISLPCKSETTVGFSRVALLILDEAARIPDDTYQFLSATRATTRGALVALSTPWGKRGWFWEQWKRCQEAQEQGQPEPWHRVRVTAEQVDRIAPEWLEGERQDIGERMYSQEYGCQFVDTIDAVFAYDDIHAALKPDIPVADYG